MINVSCHSRPCHQVAKASGAVKLLMRPEVGGGLALGFRSAINGVSSCLSLFLHPEHTTC
jgi:hypothetical protein